MIRVQKKFEKKDFGKINLEFDSLIAKINQRMNLALKHDLQSNLQLMAPPKVMISDIKK